ncbi:MAG TPA: sigma-54 dependent transcriptional regulator, partial [Candidatus Kapabacteria bacterium]|nr:sigma-54 dependent transcriptional regulator [Candidatus Kapabacteria bacterium]
LQTVENALKKRGVHRSLGHAGRDLEKMGIIAESAAMKEVLTNVELCAASDIPVLITGETGVGKEVIAHSVHQFSKRAAKKFVVIDVPSIPATMFESEVFGHTKGAFTGATEDKNGLYHEAQGGTIFLDEIGELPIDMQPKFLRVLQTKEVKKLGSLTFEHIDARVVSATNRDLLNAIREHKMREDLYYRLRGVEIYIPPLRERREDIPALAKYFLKRAIVRHGLSERMFTESACSYMAEQPWHGNARELELFVDRAAVFAVTDLIDVTSLAKLAGTRNGASSEYTHQPESYTDLKHRSQSVSEQIQRDELMAVLQKNRWNITIAAAELGVDRSTLSKQMKRLNIAKPSL